MRVDRPFCLAIASFDMSTGEHYSNQKACFLLSWAFPRLLCLQYFYNLHQGMQQGPNLGLKSFSFYLLQLHMALPPLLLATDMRSASMLYDFADQLPIPDHALHLLR